MVNRDLPSGCLAGGIPARVLKENVYPRELMHEEKKQLVECVSQDIRLKLLVYEDIIVLGSTNFDLKDRVIKGPTTEETEMLKNQFRRYGVRFRYYVEEGEYRPW